VSRVGYWLSELPSAEAILTASREGGSFSALGASVHRCQRKLVANGQEWRLAAPRGNSAGNKAQDATGTGAGSLSHCALVGWKATVDGLKGHSVQLVLAAALELDGRVDDDLDPPGHVARQQGPLRVPLG